MMASWMIYIAAASAIVALAAAMLESGLRAVRLPARFVWLLGMALTFCAAIWSAPVRQTPKKARESVTTNQSVAKTRAGNDFSSRQLQIWSLRPSTIVVSQDSPARRFDLALLAIWLSTSLITLGVFGRAGQRLRRLRYRADISAIGPVPVLITPNIGPLVIGVIRPEIIIPKWVLALDATERQLVIAHEQEHCRAGDPALLMLGAIAAAIVSWNPVTWYMLRRMRAAVELDCDQRVLSAHPNRRAYAGLLLSVAGRSQNTLLPVAGLAASVSSLEQRFRFMSMSPSRFRTYRVIVCFALGAVLITTTAMLPRPVRATGGATRANTYAAQTQSRATGRVRVDGAPKYAPFRVYATGGASVKEAGRRHPVTRDTLSGAAFGVYDVDVTDGEVHFVGEHGKTINVEAAMFGSSPADWLSATGKHIVIVRGGSGISPNFRTH